jgi:guanylate kinase
LSADYRTIVLIGPGGVGKGTIARHLIERNPALWLSRSWTTREQRPSEKGNEYVFVDREHFERAIADHVFLEWAEFHGNLYGTPLPTPATGQDVLLEIEIQGAKKVLDANPDALVILIEPPSVQVLQNRLEARGDHAEHVAKRLTSTPDELEIGRALAHHVVLNEHLESAVDEILSILRGPRRDR